VSAIAPTAPRRVCAELSTLSGVPPAPGRRRRVALYSHDTQGLGHVRRNIALASALIADHPDTDVLLLTGAPEATTLPLPPCCDVVTLPTLRKSAAGNYSARVLGTPLAEVVALRASVLRATLSAFAPDLLIVDKAARGIFGELDETLAALRAAGTTRTVLGLREVLDTPFVARREWDAGRTTEAIGDLYDAVWVYGDPRVYDPVHEYDLPESVRRKVVHTGYLGHGRAAGTRTRTRPDPAPVPPEGPYALCLVGGGQDGYELADAFVHAPLPPGYRGVVLTGPYMRRETRQALSRAAAMRGAVQIVEFAADADAFVAGASVVVSMAGYNSVCELLAAGVRTLLVPRTAPRAEQRLRAERLARRGLVDVVAPDAASPEVIGRWLAGGSERPPRLPVDLDGLRAVPVLAAALLAGVSQGTRQEGVVDVAV
jgi:predicted glycosyltransferase